MLLEAENQNPIQIPVFSLIIKLSTALSTYSNVQVVKSTSLRKGEKQKEKSQGLKLFIILSKEEVR
jgi:hypothetical protein